MVRRGLAIAGLCLLASCRFSFDRQILPGSLNGTVVFDAVGNSQSFLAVGAHVTVENTTFSALTDVKGEFAIHGLPAGSYNIDFAASRSGKGPADSGLRIQNVVLAPSGGKVEGRDLGTVTIGGFGGLNGTVIKDALPVSGAAAVLPNITQTDVTTGKYALTRIVPGDYTLTIFAPQPTGPPIISPLVTVHVNPRVSTVVPAIDLTLDPPAAAFGNLQGVAQLAGAPSSQGITITLTTQAIAMPNADGSIPSTTTTDPGGDYLDLNVPAGMYTLTASETGYNSVSVPDVIVGLAGDNPPPITLSVPQANSSPGEDAGTTTQQQENLITQACMNEALCGVLPPAGTEAQCEQVFTQVSTQLVTDSTACSTTTDALTTTLECFATSNCNQLSGQSCEVQAQTFTQIAEQSETCTMDSAPLITGSGSLTLNFNVWPVINSIAATPERVAANGAAVISLTVTDAENNPLTYAWSDNCGGSFSSATIVGPTWTAPATAPANDNCTLSVNVSDGMGGSDSGSLTISIGPPVGPTFAPVIVSTWQSAPTVDVGETITFDVTASDPQGTALTFNWSSSADGMVGAPTSTSTTSQMVWTATQSSLTYSVDVTVQDAVGNMTTYSFGISTGNLVGWWKADGTTSDSAGAHNGAWVGTSPSYTFGESGEAFNFDGTGGVQVQPSPDFASPSSVTVSAWIHPAVAQHTTFFSMNSAGKTDGPSLSVDVGSSMTNGGVVFSTAGGTLTSTAGSLTPDVTYFIIGVYDSVAGTLTLYLNGTMDSTTPGSGSATTSGLGPWFGEDHSGAAGFQGWVDDVRFYSLALDDAEAMSLLASP